MRIRELSVEGALEITPEVSRDDRGLFVSPFQATPFLKATGRPLFTVAQTNHSRSRRGVVRGIHFTVTPPGCAKYVYCPHGSALDIVVDIRVGSPTFGTWDVVEVDPLNFRSVYFPVGVGHAFVALQDDTVMSYMISGEYVPENELGLFMLDPDLALPVPKDVRPIMSERDRQAPTLAEAARRGLLPRYENCKKAEETICKHSGGVRW
jgi:epimerase EvaD